jgi:predicted SnoaL-like aldol condensation-catalyzing enzyme
MNEQLEANKKIVRDWHDLAIKQRKPEEAISKYLGPQYRHHNPGAAYGPEPFIDTVK